MQTEIGKRIELLMKHFGDNQTQFALRTKNSAKNIHSAVKGVAKPSFDVIQNIVSNILNLNPRWLISGEGEMFESEKISDENESISEVNEKSFSYKNSNSEKKGHSKDLKDCHLRLQLANFEIDILKKKVEQLINNQINI